MMTLAHADAAAHMGPKKTESQLQCKHVPTGTIGSGMWPFSVGIVPYVGRTTEENNRRTGFCSRFRRVHPTKGGASTSRARIPDQPMDSRMF